MLQSVQGETVDKGSFVLQSVQGETVDKGSFVLVCQRNCLHLVHIQNFVGG